MEEKALTFDDPELVWLNQPLPFVAWHVNNKHVLKSVKFVKSCVGGVKMNLEGTGEAGDGEPWRYSDCWFVGDDGIEYLPFYDHLFPSVEAAAFEILQDIDNQEAKLRAAILELGVRRGEVERMRDAK